MGSTNCLSVHLGFVILAIVANCATVLEARNSEGGHSCVMVTETTMQLRFQLKKYDEPIIFLTPVTEDRVPINSSCTITGDGREATPFLIISTVDTETDTEDNSCEMTVVASGRDYLWRIKSSSKTNWNRMINSYDHYYSIRCNKNMAINRVITNSGFIKPPSSEVLPLQFAQDVLRMEVVSNGEVVAVLGTGSSARLRIVANKDSQVLAYHQVTGIYPFECIVSDSKYLTDSELIIGSDRCPLMDGTYSLTNGFRAVDSSNSEWYTSETEDFPMHKFKGSKLLYFACKIEFCYFQNEDTCQDGCLSSRQRREVRLASSRKRREVREENRRLLVVTSVRLVETAEIESTTDAMMIGLALSLFCACLILLLCCCIYCVRKRRDQREGKEDTISMDSVKYDTRPPPREYPIYAYDTSIYQKEVPVFAENPMYVYEASVYPDEAPTYVYDAKAPYEYPGEVPVEVPVYVQRP